MLILKSLIEPITYRLSVSPSTTPLKLIASKKARLSLKAKKLRGVNVGGQWRIHKTALEEFVQPEG